MTFLDSWLRLARSLSLWATRAAGALLLAAALLVSVDILLRRFLLVSLGGADELSGYALAIAVSWGISHTLLVRGHVRVDALYTRLPARIAAFLDLLSLAALGLFVGFLARHGLDVLLTSLSFSAHATTPLATPLWLPQSLWMAGFVLFLFALIPLLLRAALAFIANDLAMVRTLAGARSQEEDAAEEIAHTTQDSR